MGYLSSLYNSAKKGIASGLGSLGGVFNRIGESGLISRIGGYVSQASPYVSKGLEAIGGALGQPAISALGAAAGLGMDYIGSSMTKEHDTSMKSFGDKLHTLGNNFKPD
jgi:uncharacterized protein YidB (DUF937 family)